MCSRVKARLSCQRDEVVRGVFDAGRIGIVLNKCVAQTGESQVIKERNTTSEIAEGELTL